MDKIMRRLPISAVKVNRFWTHPWTITNKWDDEAKEWRIQIAPGFVNGDDCEIATVARLASDRTLDRIADGKDRKKGDDPVTAFGIELPWLAISGTRIIGEGANAETVNVSGAGELSVKYEAVPKFFAKLGVGKPTELIGNLSTGVQEVVRTDPKESRILRAIDITLHLDRNSVKVGVESSVADLTGASMLLNVSVGRSTPANKKPRLFLTTKHVIPEPGSPQNLLDGVSDPEFDVLKVATIFFLSEPGVSADTPLDKYWTVHVKHDLFWNLAHASAKIPVIIPAPPLTIQTGLAAGLGDQISNRILAPTNEAYNEAAALISARSLSGAFWSL